MSMPGRFLTLEGGEGAGKSTQLRRLRDRLSAQGYEVVTTREPGGSPRAEAIRALVLGGGAKRFGAFAETLLFAAARADHVERIVRPALMRGAIVICDRFIDSTRVYQGRLAAVPEPVLRALERVALGDVRPNLTIVIDVPPKLGLARAVHRREISGGHADRFEEEGLSFHAEVRDGFLAIAAAEPERCAVVDGAGPPEGVERMIWAETEARLLYDMPEQAEAGRGR